MGIKCAALMPHPPIVIEEIGGQELKKAKNTVHGFKKTSKQLAKFKQEIDLVLFITPHGPVFRSTASIIIQEQLQGDFREFNFPGLKFREKSDINFSERLMQNAKEKNLKLQALRKKDLKKYDIGQELDHGIMVPLHYLKKAGLNKKIVPISIGFISYQDLYKIGKEIAKTAREFNYNLAIIASGDLSHRLKKGAPAGYNSEAHVFDEKLLEYFEEKDFDSILNFDPNLVEKAGECGLRPIVTMLGALSETQIEVEINSYEAPFGVGYGTIFIRTE